MKSSILEGLETFITSPSLPSDEPQDAYECRCEGDLMCPNCVEQEGVNQYERGYMDGQSDSTCNSDT